MVRRSILMLLLTTLLLAAGLRAGDAPVGGPGVTVRTDDAGNRILIARTPQDVGGRFVRQVQPYFKDLPKGYTMRVVVASFNAAGTNRVYFWVESLTPLNPDGKEDGVQHEWKAFDGMVASTIPWKSGVKDGIEKHYARKDRRDIVVTMEVPWKKDKVDGERKSFHKNGQLRNMTTYVDGKPDGETRSYDDEGKLTRKALMKDGKRDGTMTDYWPKTGKPKRVVHYKLGKVEGVAKEYYANGQLKREIPFKDNVMNGTEKQFEADGSLTRTRVWKHGEFVSEEQHGKKSD